MKSLIVSSTAFFISFQTFIASLLATNSYSDGEEPFPVRVFGQKPLVP